MATRTSRTESKARTRADLVAAARIVFLRRGFHAAGLEEIAEEAGYTKGAVYSNFAGKDELFLAVLDEHYAERTRAYSELVFDEPDADAAFRAVARFWTEADRREPEWTPLVVEFMTHAARHEPLRRATAGARERFLDALGLIIEELGRRHELTFRLPVREIARGSGALGRGMALERRLQPDAAVPEVFEELHAAYMRGLAVPTERRSTP